MIHKNGERSDRRLSRIQGDQAALIARQVRGAIIPDAVQLLLANLVYLQSEREKRCFVPSRDVQVSDRHQQSVQRFSARTRNAVLRDALRVAPNAVSPTAFAMNDCS